MRIGILLTGLDGGGSQRRLFTLAEGFLARGHRVEFLVGSAAGTFVHLVPQGATVIDLSTQAGAVPGLSGRKSLVMLAAVPALVRYFGSGVPDVLLCGSTPANLAALFARLRARCSVPVVVSVNVPLSRSTALLRRPLLGRLVRRLYPRADAVIANAAFLARDAAAFVGLAPERVHTIPNPVPVDAIRSAASEATGHPWLSEDAVPVVLAVGKLKKQKDFATLLRAFAEVRRSRPCRLLVLGKGEELGRLRALAADLGVADDVGFPGFVANPFPYMAAASVFVSSSLWEGFSNVIAEALACGCPVVAARCPGGVGEILGEGRFGTLVKAGDPAALAEAIAQTLDCPPPREQGRQRADQYSVARAVDAYLGVLSACVAAVGRGPEPALQPASARR